MDTVKIRTAKATDAEAIIDLIKELATFENAPDEAILNAETLINDAFGDTPYCYIYVAEQDNVVCGMALFYYAYSTWKGKMVYLEDLIVKEAYRRCGIGAQLLESVFKFAQQNNAVQVKWQVLDWNTAAINFYKKYAVSFEDEWINCKIKTTDIA